MTRSTSERTNSLGLQIPVDPFCEVDSVAHSLITAPIEVDRLDRLLQLTTHPEQLLGAVPRFPACDAKLVLTRGTSTFAVSPARIGTRATIRRVCRSLKITASFWSARGGAITVKGASSFEALVGTYQLTWPVCGKGMPPLVASSRYAPQEAAAITSTTRMAAGQLGAGELEGFAVDCGL